MKGTTIIEALINKKLNELEQSDDYLKSIGFLDDNGDEDGEFEENIQDHFYYLKQEILAKIAGYKMGVADMEAKKIGYMEISSEIDELKVAEGIIKIIEDINKV